MKMVEEIYSRVNHMTLKCDVDSMSVLPSHRIFTLSHLNIWVKFNENCPKGSGDMEWTQNSRVNPMSLTCDLESS